MNNPEDARAICPYYKRYNKREIQCESCVNRARIVFVFRSTAEALKHKRQYCDTYAWEDCPYAAKRNTSWTMDFRRSE